MTTHAMTLPGIGVTAGASCRGTNCNVYILLNDVLKGDTGDSWHAAIEAGSEAMDVYLTTYNAKFAGKHAVNCEFRILPPSVLVAYKDHYKSLEDELELAKGAR
ncbi:hypothetical protein [Streptomyces sp. NPDC057199]|uniref:hypothetical protein n=1 Tax=Streptomyces sp. NPDC057199 TaxID=3346047 RepID=UPI0036317CE7